MASDGDIVDLKRRVGALETKDAVRENNAVHIDRRLDKIESILSRINWMLIAGFAAVVIGFAMRGGFNIAFPA